MTRRMLAAALLALSGLALPEACKSTESTSTSSGGGGVGGAGGSGGSESSLSVGGSGGEGTGGTGGTPVVCTMEYTNVPMGLCDLLKQNCPIGQTCEPNNTDGPTTTECMKGAGLKGPGEDCDSSQECAAGLFCIDQCTPVCCPGDDASCGGGRCNVQVDFGDSKFVEMCAFDKTCMLLVPNACDPGYDCHIDDATQGLADCSKPSTSIVGELQPCTYLNDCHTMQDCFDDGIGGAMCHYYCYLDGRGSPTPGLGGCPSGEKCVSTSNGTAINFGVPDVGLCYPN